MHSFINFEYLSVILDGFLTFWKSKMADPRWRLFLHYDVIVTWCDAIIPSDVYQNIDFRTYYISSKFHCHCLNILEVMCWGGISPRSEKMQKMPGLNRVNKENLNLAYQIKRFEFPHNKGVFKRLMWNARLKFPLLKIYPIKSCVPRATCSSCPRFYRLRGTSCIGEENVRPFAEEYNR